ncbi:MAG: dCTP deaminase [Candidatus Dojkabacteria bacterium]
MFLSNKTIREYIEAGKITVIGDIDIESNGLVLHLGPKLLLPIPTEPIDSKNIPELKYETFDLSQSSYILKPNSFVLGSTKQSIQTERDIMTILDGRSTYARVGLAIHITAMVLDGLPFSRENSVLEIKNLGPYDIVLHEGEKIGTYLFAQLSTPIEGEKESKYKDQDSTTPPKF